MVGAKATTPTDQMSYIRKVRKPMVEKKRRERMNTSIAQLKSLIAQTIKDTTAPMTRVDKADILELTVYHLTQLQQQQQSVTLATEAAAYNEGYSACAREAVSYLSNTRMTSAANTGSLSNHLNSRMLQQRTAQRSGAYFKYPRDISSRRQMDRFSTPLRPCDDSYNSPLPGLNLCDYSPVIDGDKSLPELTSSFVYSSLNSNSSIDFSNSCSSTSVSSSDSNQSLSDDVREEQEVTDAAKRSTDIVTIGNGKENEIGHMIKEVPWRPF